MPKSELFASAAEAHERDPRDYPYGYLTGGRDELTSVRVFVWFRTMDELIDSLLDVEPRMYGVEPKRGLEKYQERVRPILKRLKERGFDDTLLRSLRPRPMASSSSTGGAPTRNCARAVECSAVSSSRNSLAPSAAGSCCPAVRTRRSSTS